MLDAGLALESENGVNAVFGEDGKDWSDFRKGKKGFFSPLKAARADLALAGSKGMKDFFPAESLLGVPER